MLIERRWLCLFSLKTFELRVDLVHVGLVNLSLSATIAVS